MRKIIARYSYLRLLEGAEVRVKGANAFFFLKIALGRALQLDGRNKKAACSLPSPKITAQPFCCV